jgi:hypothetical protein
MKNKNIMFVLWSFIEDSMESQTSSLCSIEEYNSFVKRKRSALVFG